MRSLLLIPLLAAATPALAQVATYPAPYGYPASPVTVPAIPPQMMDPALPDQLGRMAGALTHAFMNLPVGELEAAVQGRPVTPADRGKTVGSETRRTNPYVERDIQRDVASSAGTVQSSARAMQRAMPAIAQALGQAAAAIERATVNLPDPTYPRR
ncbi:MAG: hypothetical protein ABIQ98_02885 [Sphingomicrobium sp.]